MFSAAGLTARALQREDLPALQAFFEANPAYFLQITGRPPRPDEAEQEFDDRPPAHLPHTGFYMLGLEDPAGTLQAMTVLLSDFVQPAVWHIGLFIVATARHGRGDAAALCHALEQWMAGQGAAWSRLSVLDINPRAQRFWTAMGYQAVRQREGVAVGERLLRAHVMVKPLAGGTVAQYLERVARDRPDATLP